MKSIIALLALAAAGQNAPFLGINWSMVCKGEKATGFNYQNGEWIETTFKPKDWVISRRSDQDCRKNSPLEFGALSETFISRETCLSVKQFGEKDSFLTTARCREYYVQDERKDWSRSMSCDGIFYDFTAEIDGEFLRHSKSTIMRAADQRDSIVVEVGRCALTNP